MNSPTKKNVNVLESLSEDSLSEILSRTSPLDAARFAVVSKELKSAADSDNVWRRFVPMEIVSISASPLLYGSMKEFYFRLCNSHILLLNYGNLSFTLTREYGKNCFIVGAKDLIISSADNSAICEWIAHADSRFPKVALLNFVGWLDIRGKIKTDMLSQNTLYKAYLILKLGSGFCGLELVNSVVRHVNIDAEKNAESRGSYLDLYRKSDMIRSLPPWQTGGRPVSRDDGWMEIHLGEFYNCWENGGEVEAWVRKFRYLNRMTGFIVEGIEFRPSAPTPS